MCARVRWPVYALPTPMRKPAAHICLITSIETSTSSLGSVETAAGMSSSWPRICTCDGHHGRLRRGSRHDAAQDGLPLGRPALAMDGMACGEACVDEREPGVARVEQRARFVIITGCTIVT